MVNHYSVSKRRRDKELYSPGGEMGHRPDRATIVYSNMIRRAYKKMPIIIGGVEASLRRFAHFDYWDNKVRRSILADSEANLLVYGMAEQQIREVADCMNDGLDIQYIRHIPGTTYMVDDPSEVYEAKEIPSFEEVSESKIEYAKCFKCSMMNRIHPWKTLIQNMTPVCRSNRQLCLLKRRLDWVLNCPTREPTILCMKNRVVYQPFEK